MEKLGGPYASMHPRHLYELWSLRCSDDGQYLPSFNREAIRKDTNALQQTHLVRRGGKTSDDNGLTRKNSVGNLSHSMGCLNGIAYSFGGISGDGWGGHIVALQQEKSGFLKWKNAYPSQESVSLTDSEQPCPRFGHTLTTDRNHARLLLFGGDGDRYMNDVWIFTISSMQWSKLRIKEESPTPTGRAGHTAVLSADGTLLYIFGGWSGRNSFDDLWVLDINLRIWKQLTPFHSNVTSSVPPMSSAFSHDTNSENQGRVQSIKGRRRSLSSRLFPQNVSYAPQRLRANSCSSAMDAAVCNRPSGRHWHVACLWRQWMYVGGGSCEQGVLGDVWRYHILENRWESVKMSFAGDVQKPELARCRHIGFVMGDVWFVHGGRNSAGQVFSSSYEFSFRTGAYSHISHGHIATSSQRAAVPYSTNENESLNVYRPPNDEGCLQHKQMDVLPPLHGHAYALDHKNKRVVIMGGCGPTHKPSDDVFVVTFKSVASEVFDELADHDVNHQCRETLEDGYNTRPAITVRKECIRHQRPSRAVDTSEYTSGTRRTDGDDVETISAGGDKDEVCCYIKVNEENALAGPTVNKAETDCSVDECCSRRTMSHIAQLLKWHPEPYARLILEFL